MTDTSRRQFIKVEVPPVWLVWAFWAFPRRFRRPPSLPASARSSAFPHVGSPLRSQRRTLDATGCGPGGRAPQACSRRVRNLRIQDAKGYRGQRGQQPAFKVASRQIQLSACDIQQEITPSQTGGPTAELPDAGGDRSPGKLYLRITQSDVEGPDCRGQF